MEERFLDAYDPFVLPFTLGMLLIVTYLGLGATRIIFSLPREDRRKFGRSLFSPATFISLKEIFFECIIHRKIWKKKPLLGYMHMSIALGWLMIIILGHIEVLLYCSDKIHLSYYPIFFRYFTVATESTLRGTFYFFLMDFFLLMVLTGVALAIYKRFNSRALGMRRTTRLKVADQIAVYTLWGIFPLRLLAESFTSQISGGSFLTRGFGMVFDTFVTDETLILPMWWAYSIALGLFFVMLPGSRFMHIVSEPLLIFMRNAGIRSSSSNDGYAKAEIYSCSRCGVCIDACQQVSAARITNKTSVNFLRKVREEKTDQAYDIAQECLLCGRCVDACPVGVDSCRIKSRVRQKDELISEKKYGYLPTVKAPDTDTLYFAGCMGHLTPSIGRAMLSILEESGEKYALMDKDGSICCGRPLLLAGEEASARLLIEKNKKIIEASTAKRLVTSCPICYKMFREQYGLSIEVMHHSQYIAQLMREQKITVNLTQTTALYHDPCELGRGSGIYEEPRQVLRSVLRLIQTPLEKGKSLCCGNSLGNKQLPLDKRRRIAMDAASKLSESEPDILVTACPLCKKTFSDTAAVPVKDIAEVVASALEGAHRAGEAEYHMDIESVGATRTRTGEARP